MRLPDGVTGGQPLEAAPKSQPMTEAGLIALAKQRRREAEEMEAILAKRQRAEQERQEQVHREAATKAQAEQEKRDKAAQEARKWEEINAVPMPNGQIFPLNQAAWLADEGVGRVILCADSLQLPMLVDGDLVVADAGITLPIMEMVSPIVPATAAHLLLGVYQDAAQAKFLALLRRTRELMGDGSTLYTSALPTVTVTDAGPANAPSSHKVIRATWGECYIHQPMQG